MTWGQYPWLKHEWQIIMCPHSPWSSFWKAPSLLLQLHFLERHKQGSVCGSHQPFIPLVLFCFPLKQSHGLLLSKHLDIFLSESEQVQQPSPLLREILGGSVECADVYVVFSVTLAVLPYKSTTWHKHGRKSVSGSWAHSVVEEAGRAAGHSHPQKHVAADAPVTEDQKAERER